jgi:hypothetical protein
VTSAALTTPVDFPAEEELQDPLRGAANGDRRKYFTSGWKLKRIAEFAGARAPTFEDLRRLLSFTVELDNHMAELSGYVRNVRAKLVDTHASLGRGKLHRREAPHRGLCLLIQSALLGRVDGVGVHRGRE